MGKSKSILFPINSNKGLYNFHTMDFQILCQVMDVLDTVSPDIGQNRQYSLPGTGQEKNSDSVYSVRYYFVYFLYESILSKPASSFHIFTII